MDNLKISFTDEFRVLLLYERSYNYYNYTCWRYARVATSSSCAVQWQPQPLGHSMEPSNHSRMCLACPPWPQPWHHTYRPLTGSSHIEQRAIARLQGHQAPTRSEALRHERQYRATVVARPLLIARMRALLLRESTAAASVCSCRLRSCSTYACVQSASCFSGTFIQICNYTYNSVLLWHWHLYVGYE